MVPKDDSERLRTKKLPFRLLIAPDKQKNASNVY